MKKTSSLPISGVAAVKKLGRVSRLNASRQVVHQGYDRSSCWVHARCCLVNPYDWKGEMIITLQKCLMGNSEDTWDVFSDLAMMRTVDGGKTWSRPEKIHALRPWREAEATTVVISDFTPQWHCATSRIIGIGHTCRYIDGKLMAPPRPRETAYSVYLTDEQRWSTAEILQMDGVGEFFCAGAGCAQWVELPNGDILLPIYYKSFDTCLNLDRMTHAATSVCVVRCRFDGARLSIIEKGRPLCTSAYRGFGEPSLTYVGGRYWLTIRNGERAYVTVSEDGIAFPDPVPWYFNDGEGLGSYDTQQHWFTLEDRLFLSYTRSGLDNDHIVRHRAPLLIAEVDQQRRCLIRESEQVVIPEMGAQLGNFGATQGGGIDAWICASEWMETGGRWTPLLWNALEKRFPGADLEALAALPGRCGLCELGGSNNNVHLVRLQIEKTSC